MCRMIIYKKTTMPRNNFQSKVYIIWKGDLLNTLLTVSQSLFCCGYLSQSFNYQNHQCHLQSEIDKLQIRFPSLLVCIHLVIISKKELFNSVYFYRANNHCLIGLHLGVYFRSPFRSLRRNPETKGHPIRMVISFLTFFLFSK